MRRRHAPIDDTFVDGTAGEIDRRAGYDCEDFGKAGMSVGMCKNQVVSDGGNDDAADQDGVDTYLQSPELLQKYQPISQLQCDC
jgi:hypothetical protein